MWDIQIQTYCKKEAEDGKANRCSKPESPSFFTQQIYLSSIFPGVFGHIVVPLNRVLNFGDIRVGWALPTTSFPVLECFVGIAHPTLPKIPKHESYNLN